MDFYKGCPSIPLFFPAFPENYGENYIHATFDQIKDHPREWINSLPVFEYAYVLISMAASKYGGEMEQYTDKLFNVHMLPILNEYHKRLMKYRIHRMILSRKYASMAKVLTNEDVSKEYREMQKYTVQTKRALWQAVKDFRELQTGERTTPKKVEDTLPDCFPMSDVDD